MKKAYINPAMEIVKIETQQVIATSYDPTPVNANQVDAPALDIPSSVFDD